MTADIEQVQTKLTQADQIIITKTDLARRMEQDVGDRDYTIKDLHRTIDEMTEQMSKLKEKAEEGRLVIKECDKKSEETGKELANFATQYKDLSERHDVLVAQCSKAESELVYLREEYRSLEMRLESKQSECEALIKDAAASQTVQDDSLFIELRAQIGDLVSQIEVLVAEKEEMISRLEKTAEIKEDYYQKTIALEAQIKEMSLSVSNLEARLEEKEEFAKMESSKLEVATSRLEQLLSEKLVLEKDIKEARDSLATDQLAHASLLEETLSQHREKVDQLVTERVDVVKADMEEETQQLVKQMEEVCQQQVKSLEASITASKVTIKELEEELGVCRAAIEEKRVVLAELSESVKQAESKCKDLEAHLEEKALTPDAEVRSVA